MSTTEAVMGHQITNLAASAGVSLKLVENGDGFIVTGSKKLLPIRLSKLYGALQRAVVESGAGTHQNVLMGTDGVTISASAVDKLNQLVGQQMEDSQDAACRVGQQASETIAGKAFIGAIRAATQSSFLGL